MRNNVVRDVFYPVFQGNETLISNKNEVIISIKI